MPRPSVRSIHLVVRDTGPGSASTPSAESAPPPPRRWFRRAASRVTLLATISALFSQRIDGSRKCSQSPLAPCLTTSALVYAANDIEIVATAIQTPVLATVVRSAGRLPGGEGIVVAPILRPHRQRLRRRLHHVVPGDGAGDRILVRPVMDDRIPAAEVVVRRGRRGRPLERGSLP